MKKKVLNLFVFLLALLFHIFHIMYCTLIYIVGTKIIKRSHNSNERFLHGLSLS